MKHKINAIRLLTLLLTIVLSASSAYAENRFYAQATSLEPGTSGTIGFYLDNSDTFYGFQADVTLPAGLTFVSAALNTDRAPADNFTLSTNAQSSNPVIMGTFSNRPEVEIVGSSGVLVTMTVQVADNFAGGNLNLSNVKFVTRVGYDETLPDEATAIGVAAKSITLDQTELSLKATETATLTATVLPETTTDKSITWTTSDATVATVEGGIVTAVAVGSATITATCGEQSATCTVTVIPTPAASVTLDQTELSMKATETATLTATVLPATTTDKTITWTTSDASVATVEGGVVTAVAVGSATITATTSNGKTATCSVTVNPTPAASVTLDQTELSLQATETATLTATVLPATTTDKSITWSTSDASVATVEGGTVTAVAVGSATITATCGEQSATCTVTVIPTPAASVTLNQTELSLKATETATLTATVSPETTTDKSITWSTSDASIATVEGGIVTAVAVGSATITATCGEQSATCSVTVNPTPATSVTLDLTELSLKATETAILTATVSPATTTDKSITWTTSDASVATVEGGIVTAVAVGSATITATCGEQSATCTVTVIPTPAASVTLDLTELSLKATETATLTATVLPETTTDKSITWSTSDASVATVEGGIVTAVAVGSATITATCGEQSASCSVTVIPTPVTGITLDQTLITIGKGKFQKLTATVVPENATDKTVTWSSSNETAATVNDNGTVTALESGSTVITATTSNGLQASCTVNVEVPVTSIKMDTYLLVKVGGTGELKPVVQPEDATNKKLTWANSNGSVVEITSVDDNGNATLSFKAEGEATLTATSDSDPSVSAQCKVTVEKNVIVVTSISVEPTSLTLTEGEMVSLSATVMPDDATDKSVEWTSTDRNVAVVSETGAVTALSAGTAVIQARSSSGLIAECGLTVNAKKVEVTEVTLTNTELLMRAGKTAELLAIVKPDNATDKSVTWESNDPEIASVDQTGVVTAIQTGFATITATSVSNPAAKGECKVTVETEQQITAVTKVTVTPTSLELTEGDTETLAAEVEPANATDPSITWKSSDPAVASVDSDGTVTAVAPGSVTIYASSSNGLTAECSVTVSAREVEVTGISLTNTELLMRVGKTADLDAIVQPADATDQSVSWTVSDPEVISIEVLSNSKIWVTALKEGSATVTATSANGKTATCSVTVSIIAVETIELSEQAIELTTGDTKLLTATVTPDDATDKTVTWKSSDPTIASVDATGLVTAVSGGTATIYASSSNGLTAECSVTVPVEVTEITLTITEMTLLKGHTHELAAIIQPANATDRNVVWSSSDESVVTVDQNGNVTGVEVGNAIVSATSANGISAECQVTVTEDLVAVLDISLSESEITLDEGDSCTLTATLTPENATDTSVTWSSSDCNVATVSQEGVVTAVGGGTAVIYAAAHNGRTAECTVTVPVAVKEITLSQSELLMRAGKTAELIAIVKPDNATDKSLIWESSDPEVASVDENGTVTAMQRTDISANSTGTAVISVSWSKDKSINDECTVTVVPDIIAVTGIQLSETAVTLTEGETRTLTATVEPDNATDPSVTWKSSDRSVATVDTEGTVTAVAPGTAVIYASSSNGITAECQFTVTRRMVDVAGITLDMDRLVIMAGAVAQLHATVTPEDATDPSVAWTSDDDDIAIVRDGAVIAVSKGTTTVRAVTSNGLEASCVVIVTPRPLTPNKLLRKGDGSSCTFIAMMDISDKELAARGYGFVFGYTGPTGVSGIIEDSSLRYCHTTPEIYNDPSNDFWVYTYVINEFGGSDCSNLRHLDGREEICFDPSVSGYSTKGSDVAMLEDDEWMTCTESGIIVPAGTSGAQISVYTMEGAMVCSEILDDNGSGKRYIDLSRLQPGIYVVTFRESITVRSRKFILH